ncbi:MAG: Gfo/Idh/MocA family oxidoreductase, partial [Candidatus Latescibacteria bacterium]|nr:Gfo/Idh/MocA family oxidoreductase [Candidatus Latescibacterota bacterium]
MNTDTRRSGSVRWGMIGTGSIATGRGGKALSMAPDSRLVNVMGRSREKARACAEAHGVERCTAHVDELLADPEVDAVYVATPPDVHAEYTVRAADAGRHVLCEKPMALTEDECERMIDACARNGVQLMIAYYRRFYPVVQRMRELLSSPEFGEPVYARVLTSSMYHGRPTWKTDPAIGGGGYLPDNGSHRLDLLAYLLGDVAEVSAFIGTNYHAIEGDDSAAMLLRFANRAYGTVQFSWNTTERTDE